MPEPTKKSTLTRRVLIGVLFFVVVFLCVVVTRVTLKDRTVKKEIERLQAYTRELEERRLSSLRFLEYVATPAYTEEEARTKFGLKKQGEQVVLFGDMDERLKEENRKNALAQLTNRKKWWYYFFAPEKLE